MSNILVTADEHYGHRNIITYCHRPFADIDEMRETLIARHNAKVPDSQGYLTIHVGDLFWHTLSIAEAHTILGRLHGRHAFLFGNHDELLDEHRSYFSPFFEFMIGENKAGGAKIIHWNGKSITLNHFAQRVWQGSHKGQWHLFGHSHNELPRKSEMTGNLGLSFDIGVDGHDFEPWSLEEIEAKMKNLTSSHVIEKPWPGKELT